MDDLIERLEKAAGPDRQLDNAIEAAVDLPKPSNPDDLPGYPPHFTASIDDALTLVQQLPDDFGVGVLRSSYPLNVPDTGPRWNAEIWNIRDRTAKDYQQNLAQMKIHSGKHVSPAIALCIAALKARKHS